MSAVLQIYARDWPADRYEEQACGEYLDRDLPSLRELVDEFGSDFIVRNRADDNRVVFVVRPDMITSQPLVTYASGRTEYVPELSSGLSGVGY